MSSGFGDKVQAVGGATRNLTGHWKSNCHQVETVEHSWISWNSCTQFKQLKQLYQLKQTKTVETVENFLKQF